MNTGYDSKNACLEMNSSMKKKSVQNYFQILCTHKGIITMENARYCIQAVTMGKRTLKNSTFFANYNSMYGPVFKFIIVNLFHTYIFYWL
jgi:hypothetical protein